MKSSIKISWNCIRKTEIRAHGKFNEFTEDVKIMCFAGSYNNKGLYSEDSSIFAFQTIDVEGLLLNIFYNSGCGDLVVTKESGDKLKVKGHAKQ